MNVWNVKGLAKRGLIAVRGYGLPLLPFVLFLLIWWAISLSEIPEYILPSPVGVVQELVSTRWRWTSQIISTSWEVLGGFAAAGVLGVMLGIIVSWSEYIRKTLMPFIVFFNSMPKVAAAPLVLVWFGYGILPNIAMSFLISFFPVLLNTARGLSEVPYEMIEFALTYNTPKWKRYVKIRIPHALPYIMTGLKLASIMSVTGAIVGEFIASEKGLAALIIQAQSYLETGAMVGALIWISALAMVLYGFVNLMEWLLMPWARKRGEREGG